MRYVEWTDTQEFPPPYSFPGLRLTALVLDADPAVLQQYCDNFLNIGTMEERGFRYRAIFPFINLLVCEYPRMTSDDPAYRQRGYVSQNEVFFMFPALREEQVVGRFLLPTDFAWCYPMIAVDAPTSAFSGREVLGFDKLLGSIAPSLQPDGSFTCGLDLPAFRDFSPETKQAMLPSLRISTGKPLEQPPELRFDFPWSLLSHDGATEALDHAVETLLAGLQPGLLTALNLKQFRDAQYPDQAVYQALVRCGFQFSDARDLVGYETAQVEVIDNASLPLTRLLGLRGGDGGVFTARMAMSVTTDMVFDHVVNLYTAPAAAPRPASGLGLPQWLADRLRGLWPEPRLAPPG